MVACRCVWGVMSSDGCNRLNITVGAHAAPVHIAGGVPECIKKGTLFWDEAERQYWKDVYRLAGKQWPDMYNRPIAHQDVEEADTAPAQNGQLLPSSNASTSMPHAKTRSGLTRSNSDMDLDQSKSQRPQAPKLSLQQPLFKSEAALVEAAASAQSCGERLCLLSASRAKYRYLHCARCRHS